jgi:hypothetical protein
VVVGGSKEDIAQSINKHWLPRQPVQIDRREHIFMAAWREAPDARIPQCGDYSNISHVDRTLDQTPEALAVHLQSTSCANGIKLRGKSRLFVDFTELFLFRLF